MHCLNAETWANTGVHYVRVIRRGAQVVILTGKHGSATARYSQDIVLETQAHSLLKMSELKKLILPLQT